MSERFFDRYPRFYETTATRLLPNRFHQRWRMIIERHVDLFKGARVLDLASHDGRWSFAALKAGASYVEGVEGRQELVNHANASFEHYGISPESYRFQHGDAVSYLSTLEPDRFDIILNLGFFYHTLKHLEVLENMMRSGAPTWIIDTGISSSASNVIEVSLDTVSDPRDAIDHMGLGRTEMPIGHPSRSVMHMLVNSLGYLCDEVDWQANVNDYSELPDYASNRRATFLAKKLNP